ncbi:hypothetical protein KAJ27_07465 [bacterium]|nr:hypothetical protein [bacterium]
MKISKLLLNLITIFVFFACHGYPGTLVEVTGKWIQCDESQKITAAVMGTDKDGIEETKSMPLPSDEFFLNGHLYTHFLFQDYEWYACQLIHKKNGKYHVIGFAVFDIFMDGDNINIDLTPSFLFNWGFHLEDQKFYLDIDYGKCPEISKEQVIPFSLKLVREKFTFDQLHGNSPQSMHSTEKRPAGFEKFNEIQDLIKQNKVP